MHELPVQSLDYLGVIQDDFGDKCPRLKITPPFTFEEIAFGAHDRAASEQLEQDVGTRSSGARLAPSLVA